MKIIDKKVNVKGVPFLVTSYKLTKKLGSELIDYYDCTIYINDGSLVIYCKDYDNLKDFEDEYMVIINKFLETNIINCANCGKEIKLDSHIRNRYFAGIYCNNCWESKYRDLERNETYN